MQRLHLLVYFLLSLFIPGGCLLLSKARWHVAFFIPIIGLIWVIVLSLSRVVVTPMGFMALLIGLLILHMASYLTGLAKFRRQDAITDHIKRYSILALLCGLNIAIALGCHWNKDRWFGFAFYHIPSSSMTPTLRPGDVVLVDTWIYRKHTPKISDILVVKRTKESMVLVKRLTNLRTVNAQLQLYIEGDNKNRSVDSRRFGWLVGDHVIAKTEFVWISLSNHDRYLIRVK